MKELKQALSFVLKTLLRTLLRFNPFYRPVVPVQLTIYILAMFMTFLYVRDRILCTFIAEYREIAMSAWGFLLLMNFLEAVMETCKEDYDDH